MFSAHHRYLRMTSRLLTPLLSVWLSCAPQERASQPPRVIPEPAPQTAPPPPHTPPVKQYPSLPQPGQPTAFQVPAAKTVSLANGLTAYIVERHGMPWTSVELVIRCGDMDGDPLASLSAQMLGEGTTRRTKARIDEAMALVGGTLEARTDEHVTVIASQLLAKDLKLALTLMADEIMQPSFPPAALTKLKQRKKATLQRGRTDPSTLAQTLFEHVAYPEGHPYGRLPPQASDIDVVDIAAVRAFHKTFYAPNNAFVVIAGDITANAVKPLLDRTLGRWAAVATDAFPPNPLHGFKDYVVPDEAVVHLIDSPGSTQADIVLGNLALARGHDDWIPLVVANAMLGADTGGHATRSTLSVAQGPGTLTVSTQTQTDATGESIAAIVAHRMRLRTEMPATDALDAAIIKLLGRSTLELEPPMAIATKVRESLVFGLPLDHWDRYQKRLADINPEDVQRVARNYMHLVPHIVVVGNARPIEPQLRTALPDASIIRYNAELERQSSP